MRGRIYKRSTGWFIDYDVDGVRVREKIGTRELAKETLARVMDDAQRGEYRLARKCRVRLKDFVEEYMDWVKAKKRIWKRHDASLKNLKPFFGEMLLSKITLDDVVRYKLQREKQVSGATINRELACLRHLLNVAKKKGLINNVNPVTKEDAFYTEQRRVHHILTQDEIRALLEAVDKKAPHLRLAITIALHTGLRKSEILGLRWSDIDFTNRRIIIEKTKGRRTHVVPMDETLINVLTMVKQNNGTEFVFPSYARADTKREQVRAMMDIKRAFATARETAAEKYPALKTTTFHNLRRVCATMLYNSGAQFAAIQALLNHQNPKTTMIYLQVMPESLREASDILERKFGNAVKFQGTGGALEHFDGPEQTH
jgi:integrase